MCFFVFFTTTVCRLLFIFGVVWCCAVLLYWLDVDVKQETDLVVVSNNNPQLFKGGFFSIRCLPQSFLRRGLTRLNGSASYIS